MDRHWIRRNPRTEPALVRTPPRPGWGLPVLFFLAWLMVMSPPALMANTPDSQKPTPVAGVDLTRYAGTWYELAKIPNRFQKGCSGNTTADYSLREDGRINVINRCQKYDGTLNEAKGLARVEDQQTNARLKVSFFSILGIRPFWGDYWILGLGENYEFAVVGSPDRKYGWILGREPEPDPAMMEQAWSILRKQGFDPEDFEATLHDIP